MEPGSMVLGVVVLFATGLAAAWIVHALEGVKRTLFVVGLIVVFTVIEKAVLDVGLPVARNEIIRQLDPPVTYSWPRH